MQERIVTQIWNLDNFQNVNQLNLSTYSSRPNFESNQYKHNSSSEDRISGPMEQEIGKVHLAADINANKKKWNRTVGNSKTIW